MDKSIPLEKSGNFIGRLHDYLQLTKPRLAALVVFSAAMTFLMAPGEVNVAKLLLLILGGFLVTGSANGFNQIIEKDLDKLMSRTEKRPLPDNRINIMEAFMVCAITGASGVFILTRYMNILSGLLGFLAILLYTLAYTPLKRKTPLAVFVGAIPGAIPPMLGYVAATGHLSIEVWILFSIQFLWQFPHFWGIAWVLDEDYKKAGFNLLPSGKRDKSSAFQALIYTISLLPLAVMPYIFHMAGLVSVIVMLAVTIFFLYKAIRLYKECSLEAAKSLMYASFIYLPVVMIVLVLDKI